MKRSDYHLVEYALAHGHTLSVWDGEEWQVRRSSNYEAIAGAIDSVEESWLLIRDSNGNELGSAHTIPFNGEPCEYVADHSYNEYMINWHDEYEFRISENLAERGIY
jgi:hypothetical protein